MVPARFAAWRMRLLRAWRCCRALPPRRRSRPPSASVGDGPRGRSRQLSSCRDSRKHIPDIHVEVQQIPWTAAHEKLLTAYVGDADARHRHARQHVGSGVRRARLRSQPLDSFAMQSKEVRRDDFFPGIWKTNVVNGKTYGIPWYVDTRVIFYRTDLLAKAGYKTFPTTWADWRHCDEEDQVADVARSVSAADAHERVAAAGHPSRSRPDRRFSAMAGGTVHSSSPHSARDSISISACIARDSHHRVSSSQVSNLFQEFERGNIAMYICGPVAHR